jgi:hypothetical protein
VKVLGSFEVLSDEEGLFDGDVLELPPVVVVVVTTAVVVVVDVVEQVDLMKTITVIALTKKTDCFMWATISSIALLCNFNFKSTITII